MKTISKAVLTLALVSAMFAGLAHAQRDTRTPEEKEYVFRDSLFKVIGHKTSAMAAAQATGDQAAFKQAAADIAYLAGMITGGFQIEGNVFEGSLALPAIWEDFDDFTAKANDLKEAAQGHADSGDLESFSIREFGGSTCGGCHREYKKRVN
ncbi:MAG: cytochrome c [Lysobacterales bacterium]